MKYQQMKKHKQEKSIVKLQNTQEALSDLVSNAYNVASFSSIISRT